MEIHHIDQQSNSGDNSVSNGIPLCFDCHADAGQYNVNHPKGTRFSAQELRIHRDRWFEMVEQLPGSIEVTSDVELDRRVAFEINEYMTSESTYLTLRDKMSWPGFPNAVYESWGRLVEDSRCPDMWFTDQSLEVRRRAFVDLLSSILESFNEKASYWENSNTVRLKPIYSIEQSDYEERLELAALIDARLSEAIGLYDQLVYEARQRLKLDIRLKT